MAWRLLLSTTSCSSTLHTLIPSPPPLSYHGSSSSSSSSNSKPSPRPLFHSTNSNVIIQSSSFRGPLAPRGVAPCRASKRDAAPEDGQLVRNAQQAALWAAEAAYIVWLFFLPYAPVYPRRTRIYRASSKMARTRRNAAEAREWIFLLHPSL